MISSRIHVTGYRRTGFTAVVIGALGGTHLPAVCPPPNNDAPKTLFRTRARYGGKSNLTSAATAPMNDTIGSGDGADELEGRLSEAMIALNAEIEAAVGSAVHDAVEAEMGSVQGTVAEAVELAMESRTRFDLRANVNTLVALTGIVIFERGIWTAWDVYFGDSFWSELASIGVGLGIMIAVRVFDIPLAEWRRPSIGAD